MSVLPIVAWPDPRLSRVCDPVGAVDAASRALADDMLKTMYAANGRGLAAPQVGVLRRLFVMDVTWKEGDKSPMVCIDPVIDVLEGAESTNEEACLSIIGVSAEVTRPAQISLTFTDAEGERQTLTLDGIAAICAQHEMDHLDGRVIFDHLDAPARAALETEYEALNT